MSTASKPPPTAEADHDYARGDPQRRFIRTLPKTGIEQVFRLY